MNYNLIQFIILNKKYPRVALGSFDGVHKGHQEIIKTLEKSSDNKLIIKFNQKKNNYNLYDLDKNLQKLNKIINKSLTTDILTIDLEDNLKKTTKEEFIEFLKFLGTKEIIVGKDFVFGYQGEGQLTDLAKEFEVIILENIEINQEKISTTLIKKLISDGKVEKLKPLLGENYQLTGIVEKGNQLGRTINFPTLNIRTKLTLPKLGVYQTKVLIKNKWYPSITNVGKRPTTKNNNLIIETHVLNDYNQDIYEQEITLEFLKFIREEKKFKNLNELKKQIQNDINKIGE